MHYVLRERSNRKNSSPAASCRLTLLHDKLEIMTAAEKLNLISVEDYLAGELESPVKHEYLDGNVYSVADTRNAHNLISGKYHRVFAFAPGGRPCRPFNSDTKIRVRLPTHWRFYYPDASVICRPNPQDDSFQDEPAVIFEVLSKATRRIDGGEKKDAYLTIPSLRLTCCSSKTPPPPSSIAAPSKASCPKSITATTDHSLPRNRHRTPPRRNLRRREFLPERDEANDIG